MIKRLKQRGHCIIVLAEGAFGGLVDEDKTTVLEKLGGKDNIAHTPDWESPGRQHSDLNVDLATFIKDDLN